MKITLVRKSLEKKLSGDIFWDSHTLRCYSVDSSSYQIIPKLVVIPKSIDDIQEVLKVCRKHKIPIIPRGASSGLVGSGLGSGVILDMKNFDSIKISKNYVVAGAGVSKGKLDAKLMQSGRFFAPDPSVGPFCSVGGMIANNASGSHSLKYGSVIDNVKEIKFLTLKGELTTLPNNKNLADRIYQVAKNVEKKRFPKVSKNSSGYRLDKVTSPADSHKVLIGSEGTLGILVSAKLAIRKIPDKKRLFVLGYRNVNDAIIDCRQCMQLSPAALEFVDKTIATKFPHNLEKDLACVLFIEFDNKINKCSKFLKKTNHAKLVLEFNSKKDIAKWWKYRDSSLYYSIKTIKGGHQVPHIIEDAVVPLDKLQNLFLIIGKINQRFKTKSIVYGHIGNGNLHVRLASKQLKKDRIKRIARYYFSQIISEGGSISGEHGDGLARSEFVRYQYGVKNYKLFKRLKSIFDSKNLLNPSKIVTTKSTVVANLKNS